jgi:hypothetical protein
VRHVHYGLVNAARRWRFVRLPKQQQSRH